MDVQKTGSVKVLKMLPQPHGFIIIECAIVTVLLGVCLCND